MPLVTVGAESSFGFYGTKAMVGTIGPWHLLSGSDWQNNTRRSLKPVLS